MNRRRFVQALTWATAAAAAGRTASAQVRPKVVFFGMVLFRKSGDGIVAHLPAGHAHSAFLLGPPAFIKSFGTSPKAAAGSGIKVAHMGLPKNPAHLWASCIEGKTLSVGRGEAFIAEALWNRLPSVTALADAADASNEHTVRKSLGPLAATITLGGGTLRLGDPSTNPGAHSGVRWSFYQKSGSTVLGQAGSVTDVAVFESRAGEMLMSSGAASQALPVDTTIWIVNFPLVKREDKSPQLIEDGHHWLDLVEPAVPVMIEGRTEDEVKRPKSTQKFTHPCLSAAARRRARREMGDAEVLAEQYIPPDTDPCFMMRE